MSEEAAAEVVARLKAEAFESESEMFPELLKFVRETINQGEYMVMCLRVSRSLFNMWLFVVLHLHFLSLSLFLS